MASFVGEVDDACSSVRRDVRHMLVCLVSSSRRKEIEFKDGTDEETNISEVIHTYVE